MYLDRRSCANTFKKKQHKSWPEKNYIYHLSG